VLIHPQVADLDLRGPTCGDAGGRGYPGACSARRRCWNRGQVLPTGRRHWPSPSSD